jgi:cell division protease FtsH
LTSRRTVSERTAQQVDDEVSRVINDAYNRATETITKHRALLDRIAALLLERETLTREDIGYIERGEDLPPRADPPQALPLGEKAPGATEPRRAPPLIGGPEPSPA